ncbi:MAG: ABC transporter permease [Clostridia bacterium]|nr:ABC transporter permease [Clostridia bacterium]
MLAIFKREFKSYFKTPIGYIFLAAYYFFFGLFFSRYFEGGFTLVPQLLISMAMIVTFTLPIITMRLLSEDRRQKVDQLILTAPVRLSSIVLGKFFAAFLVYAIGFAPTVIFEIIVAGRVKVNVFSYFYALLGMFLLGAALISIGLFISSLTESPAMAAMITLVINILAIFMSSLAVLVDIDWLSKICDKLAFVSAVDSFEKTVFSIPDIVYFLSITAAFLFLTVRSLEKKRWA